MTILVTLITGATRGIGRSLAFEFARHGHNLLLVARSGDRLLTLAADLSAQFGVQVTTVVCDLANVDAIDMILAHCQTHNVEIDILINNAGVLDTRPMTSITGADVRRQVDLNVRAATELALAVLPGMRARRRGSIINMTSLAAVQPLAAASLYSATKAYLLHFSEALGDELQGTNIQCQAVALGPVATDMIADNASQPTVLRLLGWVSISPEHAAQVVYDGYVAKRARFSAGLLASAAHVVFRLMPRRLVRRFSVHLS